MKREIRTFIEREKMESSGTLISDLKAAIYRLDDTPDKNGDSFRLIATECTPERQIIMHDLRSAIVNYLLSRVNNADISLAIASKKCTLEDVAKVVTTDYAKVLIEILTKY